VSAVAFVVGLLVVGGLMFLAGAVLLGRGETQPPAELDRSPVELPDDRPVTGDDVRGLRISVAVRGYRMTEVDWLLDQFAAALDERDAQLAALRGGASAGATAVGAPVTEDRDGTPDVGSATVTDVAPATVASTPSTTVLSTTTPSTTTPSTTTPTTEDTGA
jgi:DivIVA domain-containing protein